MVLNAFTWNTMPAIPVNGLPGCQKAVRSGAAQLLLSSYFPFISTFGRVGPLGADGGSMSEFLVL